ncbi:MAG: hypothetical protein ACLGI6_06965, partial [Gammaproteobacteria bacterium]
MTTPHTPSTGPRSGQHPLMIAAAIAVILFCLLGTAAILGWVPSPLGRGQSNLSEYDKATLAAKMEADTRMQAPALSSTPPLAMAPEDVPPAALPAAPVQRLREAQPERD